MLCPLCFQHIKPLGRVGKRDATYVVQPAGHACQLLQLTVQADRIALQRGHIGVAVQRMKAARCVPCRAAGQLRAFQQHHIGPPKFGQMIKDRDPDDTAANHTYPGGFFHVLLLRVLGNLARGGDAVLPVRDIYRTACVLPRFRVADTSQVILSE